MVAPVKHEGWAGPGGAKSPRRAFRWCHVIWAIIYPGRYQHLVPTVSGMLLIGLSLGVGTAAYNASNNILFITLALLLGCLVLSGVLSWLNFSRLRWRLLFPSATRAQQPVAITLELANDKRLLPTYGLECLLTARPIDNAAPAAPQTTFTAKGKDVKAILQRANHAVEGRLQQHGRIDAGGAMAMDWSWVPSKRGRWEVELITVGSLFPFGFFHKRLGARLRRTITVWPALIDYQREAWFGVQLSGQTARLSRPGQGSDLLALRRYTSGDSHRLIHWKASARSGRLLVRQFSTEATEQHELHFRTDASWWPREEQFEKAVRLVATLAEELFHEGRLHNVVLDDEAPRAVRHLRDLEAILDALALCERKESSENAAPIRAHHHNVITFSPEGMSGVRAQCNGRPAATA